ncbi:putative reverse transcriptase domain-containing protein [Tanacetum coccineum]
MVNTKGSKGVSKVSLEVLDPSWLSRFLLELNEKRGLQVPGGKSSCRATLLLSGGRLSSWAAGMSLVESFCWISHLMLLLELPSLSHSIPVSLDESRSPDFDLFSDQEEYSEEEVAETMAETMEQYMSKTRADYGLGVARPKIKENDNFELKGQFLKELRTNTFSGLDHEDANEHIEKVLEIVDLFHIPKYYKRRQVMLEPSRFHNKIEKINNFQQEPNENLYQAWDQFKELLKKCPQHYLTEMQEVVLFYNGLDVPTRQILDSRGAIPSKTAVDAKVTIQEMTEYS